MKDLEYILSHFNCFVTNKILNNTQGQSVKKIIVKTRKYFLLCVFSLLNSRRNKRNDSKTKKKKKNCISKDPIGQPTLFHSI